MSKDDPNRHGDHDSHRPVAAIGDMSRGVTRRQLIRNCATVGVGSVGLTAGSGSGLAQESDRIKWQADLGSRIIASPTVIEDTVYIGRQYGGIIALNTADGSEQWRYEADGVIRASAVVDGRVFFMSDKLYALDASDGTELWTFNPTEGGEISSTSSPTVAGDTVYVGSDASVQDGVVRGEGALHALNTEDGSVR